MCGWEVLRYVQKFIEEGSATKDDTTFLLEEVLKQLVDEEDERSYNTLVEAVFRSKEGRGSVRGGEVEDV